MTVTVQSQYVSVKDTAVLIRKALKREFPGVKFSVRSNSYAGGASIDVRWTDGPRTKDVDTVVGVFAGGRFDGMYDLKYHAEHWITPSGDVILRRTYGHSFDTGETNDDVPPGSTLVHFGADYVFTTRDLSPEYRTVLADKGTEVLGQASGWDDKSMTDQFWPHDSIPTKWGCFGVGGPDQLVYVLSQHVAPDGTEYPDD